MLLLETFTAKFELVFNLTLENTFSWVFILKPTETACHPFERSACFYVIISQSFKRFQYLTLKQIFWKTKTFFKKLEYRFLVETTKIENTSFPFKTALSEANFKTNRMATTKWTFHKEWSFASNFFIFLENLFQF